MKINFLLTYFILLISVSANSQALNDRILMNVAGRDVSAGEFIRMYNKSLDPGKAGDLDNYLQLYITFKLKVADAISEGLDTTKAFKNELNGYRNQLSQNYLTDNQVKERLLQKTYQRSLTEVNAWHILITCPEGASPGDTLAAWNKARAIRERISGGESFEEVARGSSDDPSVKINGGNLGYFTVFQMITPFEDAAYTLKKGTISEPVRTPYGYHIIKVADRRPSKGKILVAHIMKTAPPGTSDQEIKAAGEAINKIYDQLKAGASFSRLARQMSDHRESAQDGGRLDWFGAGELIPELSEAAFALTDTGMFSKPVRTVYAWHIIKLLDRKAPGSFDETKSYLESKINQSYLNSLSKKSLVEKLKKNYGFSINQEIVKWFIQNTDTLIIKGDAKYDREKIPQGNIYSFSGQRLTAREFAGLIERRGKMIVTEFPEVFVRKFIEERITDQILKYENSVLEKKYPEFRYLMNEFFDGILLFEISGKRVWNRVREDSLGLHDFYESQKNNYLSTRAMDATLYILNEDGYEKKLAAALKKYSGKPESDSILLKIFNKRTDSLLVIRKGRFTEGINNETDSVKWETGIQKSSFNGLPGFASVEKVYEPAPKPFEEIEGELMTLFQESLEREWIEQLKNKYTVKINNQVFDEIKASVRK